MIEKKPRVLVVDDDVAIMQCVGAFLEHHEQMEVVGYASHAQAGIAAAADLQPDVVLLDIHMHGHDAFWACRQIVDQSRGRVRVLFYTGFPRDQYLDRCIAAGASGMVSKHSESIHNVGIAMRYVLSGNTYFSPELAKRLTENDAATPRSRLATLTHREIEVLRQLSEGRSNREIAQSLDISLRSVEKEVSDLKEKVQMSTINELLMFAANEGLIYPELLHTRDQAVAN